MSVEQRFAAHAREWGVAIDELYEDRLGIDAQRALEWAFATTVLGILWPFGELDVRVPFARAAKVMHQLMTAGQ